MLILALDTASASCGVAVTAGERVRVEYAEGLERNHSSRLMSLVASALAAAGADRRDLEGVAVTVGPGSYTGLRIGLATAKTLAFALGIPVAGVNTMEALAFAAGSRRGLISPLLDARRDRVYTALYRREGEDLVEVKPPRVAPVAEWTGSLAGEEVAFTGPGAAVYRQAIASRAGRESLPVTVLEENIRPAAVAVLGYRRLGAGEGRDPRSLVPLYLQENTPAPASAIVPEGRTRG